MSAEQRLKGHLDALVLAVLVDGPAHGYAVIEQLRERSGGQFDLPEGTVYPALHRLERTGVVSSRHETVGGRERRIYKLTRRGRSTLAAGREDWQVFAATVSSMLGVKFA